LLVIPFLLIFSMIVFCVLFFMTVFVPRLGAPLVINMVLFLLLMYIWTTLLGAAQAWMVHEVAQGKDATVGSGLRRAFANIGDVIAFAVVMMLINMIAGSLRKRGLAGRIAGGFLEFVAGIAGKLVLPAMIVTERSFMQAVQQLRHSIRAIPEIATYEIGIRPLMNLVTLIGFGIAFLLFFAGATLAGFAFFGIWILAVMIFSILINQIYYTLLYLTLIERRKVPGLKLHR